VEIRAQLLPESPHLAFWEQMQRSARKKHQTTPHLFPFQVARLSRDDRKTNGTSGYSALALNKT
jgi:hypothetical protein